MNKHPMIKAIFLLIVIVGIMSHSYAKKQGKEKIDPLLTVLKNAKEDTSKVNMLNDLSREKNILGEYEEARKYADEALALSGKISYKKGTADSYNQIGNVYRNLSDNSTALDYYHKALAINEQSGNKTGIAENYSNIGNVYYNLSDYTRTIEYRQKALAIYEQMGNKARIATVFEGFGWVYYRLSDYPRAMQNFQKSLAINEQLGDKTGIAENFHVMGCVYCDLLSDYPRALEYFQKSLTLFEQIGNKDFIARNLSNMGDVYYNLSDYPRALEYGQKALTIDEQLGSKNVSVIGLGNIGNVYKSLSDYTTAMKYFRKALKIAEEIGEKVFIAHYFNEIGNIYEKQGNLAEALKYETKGLELALNIGATDQIKGSYEELTRIYARQKNYKAAWENEMLFKQYYDSLFNKENEKKLTSLQMQYDFDKKESLAKAGQEKKDAIALKELQKQKLVRNGFVGGFAALLLFAGVFFTQRTRIKKGKRLSDDLLLNILPSEVAEELKQKGRAEAKQFDEVTVMFTDFKDFTTISEKLSPAELVAEIDTCFKAFDNIMGMYNIEKIKTIGDSYMAAGGLPVPNKTHATDVVYAALEIEKFMEEHSQQRMKEGKAIFELRIGIHSGPVVAGIVGIKKFAYDIWGDTVNIASRMESSGEAGKVNISGSTYELVKDKFRCLHRGKIEAKHMGMIDMYFVTGYC